MTRENYLKITYIVGSLIHGKKVQEYEFLSLTDIRDLYGVYIRLSKEPTFINENVKRALDKMKVKTVPCENGWKVLERVE